MRNIAVVLVLAAISGCASSRGVSGQVSEADMGRLKPDEMAMVDQARQFRASAVDEQARATLRLQDAKHELALAEADRKDADAEAQRAEARTKIASDSREPALLEQARELTEQARLHEGSAAARLDYAQKLIDARKAGLKAAEKQVALGDARVERSKLQAMQQANVPASSKYDAARLEGRVNDSQKSFEEALQKARDLDGQATAAQRSWRDLQRRFQAKRGAAPTG
jgi:hypothetical protein